MKNHLKSAIYTGLIFLTSAGFTGCFSLMTLNKSVPDVHNPIRRDTIIAIGQPDESTLKKIDDPHALVFLGEQNTYFLFEGGEDLAQISKSLDGNLIEINSTSHSMYLKDNQIWGSISLSYLNKNKNELSQDELSTLVKLGFSKNSDSNIGFEKTIKIKGMIYPKISVPKEKLNSFQKRRSISFFNPPSSAVVPTIKKVALMPVAIAADVVTSPLQILGVTFIVLIFDVHVPSHR